MSKPLKVFISYARKDADYKEDFLMHLKPLVRKGIVQSWNDSDILASEEWADEIKENLQTANVLLFLVSPAFMASDYINDIEIQKAIERYHRKEVAIVPIWIKPVGVSDDFLNKFQSLPKDRKPVSQWADQDEAWVDVVTRLNQLFTKLNQSPAVNSNHDTSVSSDQNTPTNASISTVNTPEQQVRHFISKGKTKDAIGALLKHTENTDTDKHQEALLLSSRWNGIERQERLGLMSFNDLQLERNRINAALLAILEDL